MKRKILLYSLLFVFLYLIETVFCPFSFRGVYPEYIFIAVICLSMREKEKFGALFGLIFGLFCDFSCSTVFGLKSLFFMAVGLTVGYLSENYMTVSFLGSVFVSAVSVVGYLAVTGLIGAVVNSFGLLEVLNYIFIPKLILTLPTVFIIYPLTGLISAKRRSDNW